MASKSKGSQYERDVCKYLTKWLTGKNKPYHFWRQIQSGGLATISEDNKDLSGDVRALTEEAEFFTSIFSVEIKNGYPKTSFWQFFKRVKNFNLEEFWCQCVRDARKSCKRPMLIYRKKGNKPLIGIDSDTIEEMDKMDKCLRDLPMISMHFPKEIPSLVLMDFNEFFENVGPDFIKALGKPGYFI